MANPFHPSFGVSPPLLVGRDAMLADFVEALEDGPGSSGRAALYTGARGTGKTVLLNAVEDRARHFRVRRMYRLTVLRWESPRIRATSCASMRSSRATRRGTRRA